MWYVYGMSHNDAYQVQMGDRGRLVLPAEVRRRLKLRLASARHVVRETRGLYRGRTGKRSLVDELIAERRKEARREN